MTARPAAADLAPTLAVVQAAPLADIPPAHKARVRRRVLDRESMTPPLDYAAFNSAPS